MVEAGLADFVLIGGFGGCTVTLVKKEAVDHVIETIKSGYSGKATFYVCEASEGARTYQL